MKIVSIYAAAAAIVLFASVSLGIIPVGIVNGNETFLRVAAFSGRYNGNSNRHLQNETAASDDGSAEAASGDDASGDASGDDASGDKGGGNAPCHNIRA